MPRSGGGRLDEALGVDRGSRLVVTRERRERRAARLANATGAGEIHDDAEEVGAERRASLEAVETPQEADPGLLGDILGDLARRDVLARDADERGVVPLDETRERALVAGAQGGQQGGFGAAVAPVERSTIVSLHAGADVTARIRSGHPATRRGRVACAMLAALRCRRSPSSGSIGRCSGCSR